MLKYADFGLARDLFKPQFNEKRGAWDLPQYTRRVVTPYYRPPEVCLLFPCYDEKVDVWSTACVFAELFTKRPLFKGTSELDQMHCIFKTLLPNDQCLPTEEEWPGFREKFEEMYPNRSFPTLAGAGAGSFRNYIASLPQSEQTAVIDEELMSLMEFMLQICPKKRPTA